MLIIYDDNGQVRTAGIAVEPRPAVTHDLPVMGMVDVPGDPDADGNPTTNQQEMQTGVETVIDTPAETEAECIARLIAGVVPSGARYLTSPPTTLPDVPPKRWAVDWDAGAVGILAIPAQILIEYAAEKRWQLETGGCASFDDQIINTDRDSQSKLIAEMVAIGAGLRTDPSRWKMRGEFVMLTNAQMLTVIGLARSHISNAFNLEATVSAGIAGGTVTTKAQIDAAFAA